MFKRREPMVIGLLLVLPGLAVAADPDPANSTTPACISVAPDGTIPVDVVVRDAVGAPCETVEVQLIYNAACTDLIDGVTCDTPLDLLGVTDSNGNVTLTPTVGGCCGETGAVEIRANGILLASYDRISSPDGDGDGDVDVSDFVAFNATVDGPGECFDICGCDDHVDIKDWSIFWASFLPTGGCP